MNMITISQAVATLVQRKPYLTELLAGDLINIMSLARLLKKEIEEESMKEVSEEAIAMAIRRLPKLTHTTSLAEIFSRSPDIMIRSHLSEYTVKNSPSFTEKKKALFETLTRTQEHFFTITQGIFEATIVVSSEHDAYFDEYLKDEVLIAKIDDLAAVTIRLPRENAEIPGVYHHLLKVLAFAGINIIDIVSTYRECTFLVADADADRAYSVIKGMFGRKS